jgi:predicted RNA binding protein YcfA (HicA-like mRNA interferase family)
MPKLPQVSGDALIKLLQSLGYEVLRQRGSHVTLSRADPSGSHRTTVPRHRAVAKGTLSDILSQVAVRTGVPKDELLARIR